MRCYTPTPHPRFCLVGNMLATMFPNVSKSYQLSGFGLEMRNPCWHVIEVLLWFCSATALLVWGLCASLVEADWCVLQVLSKCYCSGWSSLSNSFYTDLLKMCNFPTMLYCAMISADLVSGSGMGGISVWMRDHEVLVQVILAAQCSRFSMACT